MKIYLKLCFPIFVNTERAQCCLRCVLLLPFARPCRPQFVFDFATVINTFSLDFRTMSRLLIPHFWAFAVGQLDLNVGCIFHELVSATKTKMSHVILMPKLTN